MLACFRRGDCGIVCDGESGISDGEIVPLGMRLKQETKIEIDENRWEKLIKLWILQEFTLISNLYLVSLMTDIMSSFIAGSLLASDPSEL